MANKLPTSFRLAEDALSAIQELAALQGGSQAGAVEYLAREWKRANAAEAMSARVDALTERVEALERRLGKE